MTVRSVPRTASLAEVRDAALALLDEYDASRGVGDADDYDSTPRVHPMAEGKYLLACAELADAGILTAGALQRRARPVVDRLAGSSVGGAGSAAWGLGFSFRDLPSDEPYTITTSVVAHGLTRVSRHLRGNAFGESTDLRDRAVRWLLTDVPRVPFHGAPAPAYSPNLPVVAHNVSAYWGGALVGALPDDDPALAEVRSVAEKVDDAYIDLAGWPYAPSSPRVDLVHNAYVGWGLLTALPDRRVRLGRRLLTTLSQFGGGATWFDAYDVRETAALLQDPATSAGSAIRVLGEWTLVGLARPARAWSVGEALVLLGELSVDPVVGELAHRQQRTLAGVVLRDYLPEPRHRHGMHLAHGMASVLRRARERSARRPGARGR